MFLAALIAPAAVFFAAAGDVHSAVAHDGANPARPNNACCIEIVNSAGIASPGVEGRGPVVASLVSASRYRVAAQARFLPAGRANEQGLQVRTILAERAISEQFPQIHEMGGVRPDSLPWHPRGLAIDVMIPNPGSAEGIELGNEVVAFVFANARRFDVQDAIWRGTYYTPDGGQRGGYGHYDHVHVTTHGGGYPTGGEVYLR